MKKSISKQTEFKIRWTPVVRIGACLSIFSIACCCSSTSAQNPISAEELSAYPHFSNQQVQVKMLNENQTARDTTVQLEGYTLPEDTKYALVETDKKIKKLPENYHGSSLEQVEGSKYIMPYNLITKLKAGSTIILDVIMINRTPMEVDRRDMRLHGNLLFRLLNRNDPDNTPAELEEPLSFEVVSSQIDTITPAEINISHINTNSHEIQCIANTGLTDSVDVRIVTAFRPEGYLFYLKVEPYLEIISNRKTLQGLGIQKIPVTIMVNGSTRGDSIPVSLDVSKGSVDPQMINVSTLAPAVFTVRSESLGQAEITGHSPNVMILPDSVTYVFPWLFILFALIGGILGALARIYIGSGQNTVTLKHILLGGIYGFIGAVAWFAVGINLLSVELPALYNEFIALGISALISSGITQPIRSREPVD